MNGHESHMFPEFNIFCMKNQIVFFYMPLHVLHLLQPLDMSCFASLKQLYRQQIENQIQCGINHVDKMDFLFLYLQAYIDIFTEQIIQSGFEATGLILYKSEKVLLKL